MKSERLMDLISEIDPELIESADIRPTKKKASISPVIISLLATVACVAVVLSVGYYVMISKEMSKIKSSDKQSITWENLNNDNKDTFADEPEKKIDVKIDQVDEYGCTLHFTVNNEDDYEKYYTYGDYVLHKQTEDGEILVTPRPLDKDKIQGLLPVYDEPEEEKTITVSTETISLDKEETSYNIVWFYNYGDLEKGDYYITVDIYDSENGTIIQTDIPFTIE